MTGDSSFSQILTNQYSDWGASAYDRRHRFSVAYVWQVPHFQRNTFLRAVTDAWQWSGIATLESGTPNTVAVGFDIIGNGHTNARPDLGNPNAPLNSFGFDGGYMGAPLPRAPITNFNCVLNSFGAGPYAPPSQRARFISSYRLACPAM